jgi:hypothetical protein
MKNPTPPRPGRRPRTVEIGGPTIDIGEQNMEPIPFGFSPEPEELSPDVAARGVPRETDVRAPAAAARVQKVPAKNLR